MLIPRNILGLTRRRLQNTTTKRKLYHAEYLPSTFHPSPSLLPQTSIPHTIRDRQPPMKRETNIEEVLDRYLGKWKENGVAATVTTTSSTTSGFTKKMMMMNYNRLPLTVRTQLQNTSDAHVKLDCLLSYKYPFRIKPEFVEDVLISDLKLDPRSELVNSLSEALCKRLAVYYLTHKQFDQVANIICQVMKSNYQQDLEKMSYTIFNTLKDQHDLKFGFMDLMKSLYTELDGEKTLFKFHYTMLTNNERTMSFFEIDYEFDDVWKMIQLDEIIQNSFDVELLPRPYWKTSYDYINAKLGIKCFEQGKFFQGFKHMQLRRISAKDGIIYRMINACKNFKDPNKFCPDDGKTRSKFDKIWGKPTDLETKISKMISINSERNLSMIDIESIFKFTKNVKMLNTLISKMADNKSIYIMKDMHLKKLIDLKKISLATNLISNNIERIYKLDTKLVSFALTLSHNDVLLSKVIRNLPTRILKSFLINEMFKNQLSEIHKFKECKIPEKQYERIEWILKSCEFKITSDNFNHISIILNKLPINLQKNIISQISGPSTETYFHYLSSNVPLSSNLIPILINTNKIITKSDMRRLVSHMMNSYSIDEIITILQQIKMNDIKKYEYLNYKITTHMCHFKKFQNCFKFLNIESYHESKLYFNKSLVLNGHNPAFPEVIESNPLEKLKFKVLRKLLDPTKLGYTSTLRHDMNILMHHNKVDKDMALLVLKKVVKKIKSNGEMIATERLKWSVMICIRYGVPKNVVAKVLQS